MGWEDRPYYRNSGSGSTGGNVLMWLLTGSVHLFTAFGIRVRLHAMLLLFFVLILLFGLREGYGDTAISRLQQVVALFGVILLHEFGHCFAARWVGGHADEILMTPLGGLAMAMAPRRPWPTFVTVAGGPLVNVIICLLCGLGMYIAVGYWPLGEWGVGRGKVLEDNGPLVVAGYLFWLYQLSYALLLFNLLPVFPLDGGQLLQSILWRPLGYFRSMMITMNVGLVGSVLMIAWGVVTWGYALGGMLLILIGISCLINCYRTRAMLRAEGPWGFSEEDSMDYGAYAAATYKADVPKRRTGWFAARRANREAKEARETANEQQAIDTILAKVSAQGMNSLTRREKRTLAQATENQRKRDQETKRRVNR